MKYGFLFLLFANLTFASSWPTNGWSVSLGEAKKFEKLDDYLFDMNEDYLTNCALVIHNGKIVYERYEYGFNRDMPQRWWSASKSVANALIARAVEQGKIRVEDPISRYIVTMKPSRKKEATLVDLLHMSPGLSWLEGYEAAFWKSDVVKMLYTYKGFSDMASYASFKKYKRKPGEKFHYSSGFTNLLMAALKGTMSEKEYDEYPWKELFNKIGVQNATWERDKSGTYVGSSYLFMPPRQMAKVAFLFLNNGKWNNEKLFPENWLAFTTTVAPSIYKTKRPGSKNRLSYGAHWWLNQDLPQKNAGRIFPDVPEDLMYASGHHGQHVHVLPSKNLIVIRTGRDRKAKVDVNTYLKFALEGLE